ncbi:ferredoxin [Actinomadura sp. NBRC 104412]|uniref:PDR/VanB family oxidoreductase n=1 Tax=Actinomadura sp. NBRC 104412 TaxID=3032203 RepID=UPI0024A39C9A|nr:PDR/VanB family oxidoreductase [Actinomadura sp. NBRC 104412]GLZ02604.1 ferredoxin [Actinomadura sp. NBRC 104412]
MTSPAARTVAEWEDDLLVARKEAVAAGVVALHLVSPSGADLPAWRPGAHIDLLLPSGLVRQYSLCGRPGDLSTWRVAVLREPDGAGGSAYVHDRLAAGQRLRVRGPRNHFELEPADRYLFIAGGIGITPLLPMVESVQRSGAPWRLVYGGRSRASMAFTDELARYGTKVELRPQDETGLLDLDTLLGEPRPGTKVYCCGPEALLTAVEERCSRWPGDALRVERFRPRRPGPSAAEDSAFLVELASSGRVIEVPPHVSILAALEEAGVPVLNSCREGTCGTCETTVLDGEPDHRDSVLTPEERASGEFMMICVSRARGDRLVLDL